jgi:drug/metabolite transporter (DMT)-like permease
LNQFLQQYFLIVYYEGSGAEIIMKYIGFILFTVMTNAAAQLMLKQGMMSMAPLNFEGVNPILKLFQVVFNPWVFFGLCTFVISMGSHLFVLSKVELSFAYPFLSLAYVAVAVFAYFIFREDLNAFRIAGIACICAGTVLIAQSGSGLSHRGPDQTTASIASQNSQTEELAQ